jgi:hypothetical protein
MDVYMFSPDADRCRGLDLVDGRDQHERFHEGRPFGRSYEPMRVEPLSGREQKGLPLGDFPQLNHPIPVMSRMAIDALSEHLEDHAELLALESAAGVFFAVNVTNVADALDLERSEVKRFRSGRIMRVVRYELRREAIEPAAIFKLPEPEVEVYVTDAFRDAVEGAGLEGLAWDRLVWSDDPERAEEAGTRLDLHA